MTIKQCGVCYENILCHDDVVVVEENVYHDSCVQLSPREVAVFSGNKFLGVTQEFETVAFDVLTEDEYEGD